MTAREAFNFVRYDLEKARVTEPEAKAKEIVAHALKIDYADIFFYQRVEPPDFEAIQTMTRRCAAGEPVQYVTGLAYFRHLTLSVTPDVLIPRRETELVAERAIDLVREQGFKTALDMCTGSGCIAIALATETSAAVEACDISEKALVISRRNALDNSAAVRFFTSDMFEGVSRQYDLIVCNPPYVSEEEFETLSADVHDHEPRIALVAEDDGYAFYRRIASEASQYLTEDGMLVLEIGAKQAQGVEMLLRRGFASVARFKDYEGRNRIITARKKTGVQCLIN